MRRLTVLYDAGCGFCVRCKDWLERQPQLVPLDLVPARSAEARRRFPALRAEEDELVVVSDDGGVYRDTDAWLMCLYALDDFREWALWLAEPGRRPLARRVFGWLTANRGGIASLAGLRPELERAVACRHPEPPRCAATGPAAAGGAAARGAAWSASSGE
jgi:predicted DCC family thiol-disulfide oxidoreductase YuxK